ncbi:hypothetical protein G6F57_019535 [Rhizopus arrhizus]|nr:hypothetical protein G6F57_019535 [Rhizopus arrhizus]
MRHVGQQVARHDAPVRYAERACGLHVFQFPQLQRFRAQQAAQPRPTGQAKNHAKQEQPQVRARDRGVEQVGVVVDIDLHHQRASRHQQHAGNRGNGGVQVLDGVVDLALEVSRRNAEDDGRRQHGDGGQAADDQRRADAFQRLPQHVVADAVGAQRVVAAGQAGQRTGRQAKQPIGRLPRTPTRCAAPGRRTGCW